MILGSIAHQGSLLLVHLIASAVRSLCLGCFAALALRASRTKIVSARLAVWTALLYAALAMPLLGIMLPSVSLQIPGAAVHLLPRPFGSAIAPPTSEDPGKTQTVAAGVPTNNFRAEKNPRVVLDRERITSLVITVRPVFNHIPGGVPKLVEIHRSLPWIVIFSGIYFLFAVLFLARLCLGIIFSRRLVHSARPICDSDATGALALRALEAGLLVPPLLAESELISVPVTVGILRPVILFPIDWRKWSAAALHAVIAHEVSHVIRRDALTQRLSLLHRAIFWFSPLGWWLHRCLVETAEEASDEAALVSGADRASYAETLLGFVAALQQSPRRVYWQGVSMAKAGQAEKRVDRILAWKGDVSMRINRLLTISLLLLGVLAILLAAVVRPSAADNRVPKINGQQDQTVNSKTAPAISVRPVQAANAVSGVLPTARSIAAPIKAPGHLLAAHEPAPGQRAISSGDALPQNVLSLPDLPLKLNGAMSDEEIQKMYQDLAGIKVRVALKLKQFQEDRKFQNQLSNDAGPMKLRGPDGNFNDRYVIVSGDSPIFMSGDAQDVEHATSLRSRINGDFIWFQRGEKSYLIRDQATVKLAKEFFKAQQELGEKQQALGKQQQALGDQQRDVGKKLETVRVQIPDMTADMQKLEDEMKQLNAGGTQQQLDDLQRQIGELQRKIGRFQFQDGDQQRQIGDQMRDLGHQQADLGRQQAEVGHQQAEAIRQARNSMKQLLDGAIARGTAESE